jgi:hypothetical protein
MKHLIYLIILLNLGSPVLAAPSELISEASVEISRFSAARIQNLITLNWNTVGESNNLGFEIERRSQFDSKWQTVAYVRGRGTATSGQSYSFVERMDLNAVLFYRLKQIGLTGASMYTQAVTVTPDILGASMRVSRPSGTGKIEYNQVSFVLPKEGTVRISVHDVFGREVRTVAQEKHMNTGYHVLPFGSAALPAGTYSVRLETTDGTLVETLLKTS